MEQLFIKYQRTYSKVIVILYDNSTGELRLSPSDCRNNAAVISCKIIFGINAMNRYNGNCYSIIDV